MEKKLAYEGILRHSYIALKDIMPHMKKEHQEMFLNETPELLNASVQFASVELMHTLKDEERDECLELQVEIDLQMAIVYRETNLNFQYDKYTEEFIKRGYDLTKEEKLKNIFSPVDEEGISDVEQEKLDSLIENLEEQAQWVVSSKERKKIISEAYQKKSVELAERLNGDGPIKWIKFH